MRDRDRDTSVVRDRDTRDVLLERETYELCAQGGRIVD